MIHRNDYFTILYILTIGFRPFFKHTIQTINYERQGFRGRPLPVGTMIVGDLSPSLESPEQVIVELSAGWRTDDGALSDTLLGESKKKIASANGR